MDRNVAWRDFQSVLCPAYAVINNKQYDGKVVIHMLPFQNRDGLTALIRCFLNKIIYKKSYHYESTT